MVYRESWKIEMEGCSFIFNLVTGFPMDIKDVEQTLIKVYSILGKRL